MSITIHFGDQTVSDPLGHGLGLPEIEPQWGLEFEEAFRSPQKYGKGKGNASSLVRFTLVSQHVSLNSQIQWQLAICAALFGSDFVTPRDFWYVDTGLSPVPFAFGMALPNPPKFIDQGLADGYYITHTQYEFVCGLLAVGGNAVDGETAVAPPQYMPNLWLPNTYGLVVRRQGDSAWIQVTFDMANPQLLLADLGGDPGATNYDAVIGDVEWPSAERGFGFYETGKYRLIGADDYKALTHRDGVTAADFAAGYTSAKGLVFAVGQGPVIRTPSGFRMRLIIKAGNELDWEIV